MADEVKEEARSESDLATLSRGVGVNILTLLSRLGRPVFYLLAARLYSTASYGLFFLAWTWVNLFSRFAFFGLDKALLRHVAHHHSRGETHRALGGVKTAFFAGGILSLAVSLVCVLFSDALGGLIGRDGVEVALRWMAFVVFFQTAGGLLLQVPIAHKVMEYQLYLKGLAEPALLIGFAILFYFLQMDLTGIAAAYLAATGIVFCCSILPVFRFYPRRTWSDGAGGVERTLFRFSFSMFLIDLITELNGRLDVVIVGSLIEPETIAVYGVMIQLAGIVRAVPGAFDPIANPFFAEYHARGEIARLGDIFKLVTRWVRAGNHSRHPRIRLLREPDCRIRGIGIFGGIFLAADSAARRRRNGCFGNVRLRAGHDRASRRPPGSQNRHAADRRDRHLCSGPPVWPDGRRDRRHVHGDSIAGAFILVAVSTAGSTRIFGQTLQAADCRLRDRGSDVGVGPAAPAAPLWDVSGDGPRWYFCVSGVSSVPAGP